MVAGDEVRAVPRLQLRQRCRRRAEVLHAAVDQVADDRDEVGLGGVDRVDDLLGEAPAEDRAQVDVADHRDPVTVRRARELGQRHGDALHARGRAGRRTCRSRPSPRRQRRRPPRRPGRRRGDARARRRTAAADSAVRGLSGTVPPAARLSGRVPGRLPGLRRLRGHAVRGHRRACGRGRCGARPPRRQPAQQRPYDLTRHHAPAAGRSTAPATGSPARPGPAGARRARRARSADERPRPASSQPPRDHRRTRSAGGARSPGGVAEQAAPQVPV